MHLEPRIWKFCSTESPNTKYNHSRKLFSVKSSKFVFKDFRVTLNSKLRFNVQGHLIMNMFTLSWKSVKSLMLDSVQKIDLLNSYTYSLERCQASPRWRIATSLMQTEKVFASFWYCLLVFNYTISLPKI